MSLVYQTYLIKFPSSKILGPNEKGTKKETNSNFSELSLIKSEPKEDFSINEHLNQNDKNTFSTKIGFMTKNNLSFHSKFEIKNEEKEKKNMGTMSMSKQTTLQIEKLMKKIDYLEEENANLQKINNFSGSLIEENKALKKKLEQYSKEMDDKMHTIDTLSNEISVIKDKFENEIKSYFLMPPSSYKKKSRKFLIIIAIMTKTIIKMIKPQGRMRS